MGTETMVQTMAVGIIKATERIAELEAQVEQLTAERNNYWRQCALFHVELHERAVAHEVSDTEGEVRRLALLRTIAERDAALARATKAEAELVDARAILSTAVGHEDEPHETLADCARLLVVDCDAEHERAMQAEAELAALKARTCPPWLVELAERLRTQDNACTANPVFTVQQRKRITGLDPQWSDDHIVWLDDDFGEMSPGDSGPLEKAYQETHEEPEGYTRTAYVEEWEYVMAFFTNQAALDYIESNRHRMVDPRVYVDSAYRNTEWQQVVKWLLECGSVTEGGAV